MIGEKMGALGFDLKAKPSLNLGVRQIILQL